MVCYIVGTHNVVTLWVPTMYVLSKNIKNIKIFSDEIFNFYNIHCGYPQCMFTHNVCLISIFFLMKFLIFTAEKISVYCMGKCS